MRKGLAELIHRTSNQRVVMQAANGKEFIDLLPANPEVEIAIVDLNMPVMDGYETMAWLRDHRPDIRPLALTFNTTEGAVIKAMKCGARGFILKDIEPKQLEVVLDHLYLTGYYHNDLVHHAMIEGAARESEMEQKRQQVMADIRPHELEFLKLVSSEKEMTYEEIAMRMRIHPRTVEMYRERLFEKLGVRSKTGLVLFAIKWGIVKV